MRSSSYTRYKTGLEEGIRQRIASRLGLKEGVCVCVLGGGGGGGFGGG